MDKKIQIPKSMIEKVIPITNQSSYLEDSDFVDQDTFCLKSTQNFLQGVFNYLSSFKADVCNNYTNFIWQKLHPDEILRSEYLVHSDDYALCVSVKNNDIFEKFRSIHKITMKLCNIEDSNKKTNCQNIFLEFISLISFNGALCYPTIKKTKECSSSLPGENFKGDSDSVCSRTAECVRVGVDNQSAWMFHRIHMCLLRRLYSLHRGGRNFIKDRFNIPAEIFGQSDAFPPFYFLCQGDPNNYRLLKCSLLGRSLLKKLIGFKNAMNDKMNDNILNTTEISLIPSPTFLYNRKIHVVDSIRKSIGITSQEAFDFFEDNTCYNFVKPIELNDYLFWLKAMYFKNSFLKAYNKDTKTIRLLRLSYFVRSPCCTFMDDNDLNNYYAARNLIENPIDRKEFDKASLMTINEIINKVNLSEESDISDHDLTVIVIGGDSTILTLYEWFRHVSFTIVDRTPQKQSIACKAPFRPNWMNITKYVEKTIMYIISEELFWKNYPTEPNIQVIQDNCKKLETFLPGIIEIIKTTKDYKIKMTNIQLLYNACSKSLDKNQICITSKRDRQDITGYMVENLHYFCFPDKFLQLTYKEMFVESNPFTLETTYILGKNRTSDIFKLLLHNLSLIYTTMTYKQDYTEKNV